MSHITDTELQELRDALDVLWGTLEVDQLDDLARHQPEVIDTCRNNHQLVSHE